ncbi:hypothetical protein MMC25_001753 [Agyrium rufum]|nr:hypothetical protein [Agyrium rufum]
MDEDHHMSSGSSSSTEAELPSTTRSPAANTSAPVRTRGTPRGHMLPQQQHHTSSDLSPPSSQNQSGAFGSTSQHQPFSDPMDVGGGSGNNAMGLDKVLQDSNDGLENGQESGNKEKDDEPGHEWRNPKARDEAKRAMDAVLDRGFNLMLTKDEQEEGDGKIRYVWVGMTFMEARDYDTAKMAKKHNGNPKKPAIKWLASALRVLTPQVVDLKAQSKYYVLATSLRSSTPTAQVVSQSAVFFFSEFWQGFEGSYSKSRESYISDRVSRAAANVLLTEVAALRRQRNPKNAISTLNAQITPVENLAAQLFFYQGLYNATYNVSLLEEMERIVVEAELELADNRTWPLEIKALTE